HVAGGHGDGVAPGGQGGVFKGGVCLAAVERNAGLGGQPFGTGTLVPGPEGVKEDLHKECSFPVFCCLYDSTFRPRRRLNLSHLAGERRVIPLGEPGGAFYARNTERCKNRKGLDRKSTR